MLGFWTRELLGWTLLIGGLCCFVVAALFVINRLAVGASIMAFMGLFIFRAGVHFLKVAVAAKVLLDLQRKEANSS